MSFRMRMSVGQQIRQTQSVAQSIRLTQSQRQQVQSHVFELRMDLIESLRAEKYSPKAKCPKCEREMTPVEIINGFNQDPNDFTTACSGCGHRFQPRLICFGRGVNIELPFFCDCQTLGQMRGKETLSPEEFAQKHPAIYRSAIVHHGGVRRAFEKIDITYPFEEISDWRNKIRVFLGRLPDTVIATCVDVSVSVVRGMRRKAGIGPYRLSKSLKEAGIDL